MRSSRCCTAAAPYAPEGLPDLLAPLESGHSRSSTSLSTTSRPTTRSSGAGSLHTRNSSAWLAARRITCSTSAVVRGAWPRATAWRPPLRGRRGCAHAASSWTNSTSPAPRRGELPRAKWTGGRPLRPPGAEWPVKKGSCRFLNGSAGLAALIDNGLAGGVQRGRCLGEISGVQQLAALSLGKTSSPSLGAATARH